MVKQKEFRCSASTVNLFLKDPCLFILKYYYGMTSEFGIHAMRGKAIEHGVDIYFETGDINNAVGNALEEFLDYSFNLDEDVDDVENLIPEWTENAINSIKVIEYPSLPKMQTKLEFDVGGLPFVGYLDYEYKDSIIDLKTVTKVPPLLVRGPRKGHLPAGKADNVRQQVLYLHATGKQTRLLYVSPEDSLLYTIQLDEYALYMEEINQVVEAIKNLLTRGEKWGINKYTPNEKLFRGFYYNDEMIAKVLELWDINNQKED